jgi:hypothetical protein
MSQFGSFEQTPRCDLIEHLAQIDNMYKNKLEELRALDSLRSTLLGVIGVTSMIGSVIELNDVA